METSIKGPNDHNTSKSLGVTVRNSLNEIWKMLFLMIPSYEGVKGNI